MKYEEDHLIFSSGKKEYTFAGIVGLDPDCISITYGYDGDMISLPEPEDEWDVEQFKEAEFTKADLHELADYMVERWKKFKENIDKYVNFPSSPSPTSAIPPSPPAAQTAIEQ